MKLFRSFHSSFHPFVRWRPPSLARTTGERGAAFYKRDQRYLVPAALLVCNVYGGGRKKKNLLIVRSVPSRCRISCTPPGLLSPMAGRPEEEEVGKSCCSRKNRYAPPPLPPRGGEGERKTCRYRRRVTFGGRKKTDITTKYYYIRIEGEGGRRSSVVRWTKKERRGGGRLGESGRGGKADGGTVGWIGRDLGNPPGPRELLFARPMSRKMEIESWTRRVRRLSI